MEFLNDNIHKTAIDYARENKNYDIVDLLNREKAKTKKPSASEFQRLKQKNDLLIIKNREQDDKIKQIEKLNNDLAKERSDLKEKIIQLEKDNRHLHKEKAELRREMRISNEKLANLMKNHLEKSKK